MRKPVMGILTVFFIFILLTPHLLAQVCRVEEEFADGSYKVRIGDKTYRAISEEAMRKILILNQELKACREKIIEKDKLLEEYRKLEVQYEETLGRQKAYIDELEALSKGYKELYQGYKKLKKPFLSLEGGIGVTGSDARAAVMLGLGVKNFRLMSFLQKNNAGVLLGLSLPIF